LKITTNQRIKNLVFASLILFFLLATGFGAVNAKFKENDKMIQLLLNQVNPIEKKELKKMSYSQITNEIKIVKSDLKIIKTKQVEKKLQTRLLMLESIFENLKTEGK